MRELLLATALAGLSATAAAQPAARFASRPHRAPAAHHMVIPADGWNAEDPADSLWRVGQRAIADEDYARAESVFASIVSKYPKSEYAGDALYWRAWSLYHLGGRRNLERAVAAIDRQASDYANAKTRGDAGSLRARILGEQAGRGDREAAVELSTSAARLGEQRGCSGDDETRSAALQALLQMDAEEALPILREVLAKRDACSESLRRQAVFIVSQKGGDDAANLLLQVARTDPSQSVRAEAVSWLGQAHSSRAAAALDSIASSSTDETMLDKAIFALSQTGSDRGRDALRRIAADARRPTSARTKAVFWLGQAGGGEETLTFLRELFRTSENDELRGTIFQAVAQSNSSAALKWLLDIARDKSVSVDSRKNALFWAGQNGADVKQIVQFYDEVRGDTELQNQAIFVLSQRREAEATDKLMDIAAKDPNREARKQAIFWLGQKKDPRIAKFLLDLINR